MEKAKSSLSTGANIFYFIKLLFKISPLLVIGEALSGIFTALPTRLIAVIGAKYVADTVESGSNARQILYAVIAIAAILIASTTATCLFREFYWNIAREKANAGLSKIFYDKAKSLDLASYDDPYFYNNFILAIESSTGNLNQILTLIRRYIGEVVSFITICGIILALDPICMLIILATVYFGLFVRGKRVFHDFAFRPMGIYKVATFGIKHFGLTLCFLADSFEDSSNLYGEWSVMCQSITFFIGIRTTDGNLLYLPSNVLRSVYASISQLKDVVNGDFTIPSPYQSA